MMTVFGDLSVTGEDPGSGGTPSLNGRSRSEGTPSLNARYRSEGTPSLSGNFRSEEVPSLGEIPMPEDFRYREVFSKGRPAHAGTDPFRCRHPLMDLGRRAKIFAPFDALKGFNEATRAKDVLYVEKRELNEEENAELNRCLRDLRRLTEGRRSARVSQVTVSVTYYVPCSDRENEAWGCRGRYETVSGICMNVDPDVTQTICLDGKRIRMEDILRIERA